MKRGEDIFGDDIDKRSEESNDSNVSSSEKMTRNSSK